MPEYDASPSIVIKIIWHTLVPGCRANVRLEALKISSTVWLSTPGLMNDAVMCTERPSLAKRDRPSIVHKKQRWFRVCTNLQTIRLCTKIKLIMWGSTSKRSHLLTRTIQRVISLSHEWYLCLCYKVSRQGHTWLISIQLNKLKFYPNTFDQVPSNMVCRHLVSAFNQ